MVHSDSVADSDDVDLKQRTRANRRRNHNALDQNWSSSEDSTSRTKSSRSGCYRLTSSDMSQSTFSIYEDGRSAPKRKHNPIPSAEFQKAVAEFKKDYTRKLKSSKITKTERPEQKSATATRQPLSASNSVGNQKAKDCVSDDETVIDDIKPVNQEKTLEGRSRFSMMLDGHFCMGCGIRRATKHQVERAQMADDAPWKNLCKPCIKRYCDGSKYAMGEFGHLCWGCGFARSAHFHKQHPVGDDENPVPNICSFCRLRNSMKEGKTTEKARNKVRSVRIKRSADQC
ncbi:hypothetical protein ACHAQH_000249 [Verticillium albo-atrum]